MNKEKIIRSIVWISSSSLLILLCSIGLFIGFNNNRYGDPAILIIAFLLLPFVFYCAYKGIKLIIEVIFDEP